ncbi:MAG: hypothetical protein ACXWC7_01610, partial [Chitinophagaceae bacterium]
MKEQQNKTSALTDASPAAEERATRRIAIFGSTGSIGTQALEVIAANPLLFSVEILTAYSNDQLLIEQALKFNPNIVVIG